MYFLVTQDCWRYFCTETYFSPILQQNIEHWPRPPPPGPGRGAGGESGGASSVSHRTVSESESETDYLCIWIRLTTNSSSSPASQSLLIFFCCCSVQFTGLLSAVARKCRLIFNGKLKCLYLIHHSIQIVTLFRGLPGGQGIVIKNICNQ